MIGYGLMFLLGALIIIVGTVFVALTVRHWSEQKKQLPKKP